MSLHIMLKDDPRMTLVSSIVNNQSSLGRRQGHPTPVLLPGKSHGRRSLVGSSVHGVAKSQTRLSDFPFTFHFHALEKEMATHSSILAWRIPGWRSLVGYSPRDCKESDMTEQLHYIYMQINRYNRTYISNIYERKILRLSCF